MRLFDIPFKRLCITYFSQTSSHKDFVISFMHHIQCNQMTLEKYYTLINAYSFNFLHWCRITS
jgi:hypothetical protein